MNPREAECIASHFTENANTHDMHLLSFGSSTIKRESVGLLCNAKRTRCSMPPSMGIASVQVFRSLKASCRCEATVRKSPDAACCTCSIATAVVEQTTCCPPVPKQAEDKRLSIELAGLRQMLWEGDELSHQAFFPNLPIGSPSR